MAYSSTNPVSLLIDGFASAMPRFFKYASSHGSSDIALIPASTSGAETGRGFFKGAGDGGHGLADVGMRVGDVVLNVVSASSTDPLAALIGTVTLHSVIACTADSSTVGSSFAYDVTLSQSSL